MKVRKKVGLYPRTRRLPGETLLGYLCRLTRTLGLHPRRVLAAAAARRRAGVSRSEVTPALIREAVVKTYPHAVFYAVRHNRLVWGNKALGLTPVYYADWLKEGLKSHLRSETAGVYCPDVHTPRRPIVKVLKSEVLAVFAAAKFTKAPEWGAEKLRDKINTLPQLKEDPLVRKMDKKTRATFDRVVAAVEKGEEVIVAPDPKPKTIKKEESGAKVKPKVKPQPKDAPDGPGDDEEGGEEATGEEDFDDDPSDSDVEEAVAEDEDDQEDELQDDADGEEDEEEAAEGERPAKPKPTKKGKTQMKVAAKKKVVVGKKTIPAKAAPKAAPAKTKQEPAGLDYAGSRLGSGASLMNMAIGPKPITKEQWEKTAKTDIRSPHVHKLVKVLGFVTKTPDGRYHLTKKGVAAKAKA